MISIMRWRVGDRSVSTVHGTTVNRRLKDTRMRGVKCCFRYKKFASESEAREFIAGNIAISSNHEAGRAGKSDSFDFNRKRKWKGVHNSVPAAKIAKQEKNVIDSDFADSPVVYTDGACSSNGTKNARAGWGVFWGDGSSDNDCGPVYGAATNNRGELIAVEKAIEKAIQKELPKVVIKTDSNLLIQSMNTWIHNWKRNGWKTSTGSEVVNQDVLMKIDSLRQKLKVKFVHVRGHAGIEGNERADELARKGAQMFPKTSESDVV